MYYVILLNRKFGYIQKIRHPFWKEVDSIQIKIIKELKGFAFVRDTANLTLIDLNYYSSELIALDLKCSCNLNQMVCRYDNEL